MFEKPRQFAHVQIGDGEGEEGGRSKDKKGERTKKGGERTSKANLVEVTLHKRESNKSSSSSPPITITTITMQTTKPKYNVQL